ncbi:uncharacterized protein HKW66_Vig0112720 [Vigna angularis]|nr:uncharacterized protein HKW66_Vig0112720 [Vigna angularis]
MDDICQRIRDSAHNLLPKQAFDESSEVEDHKGGEMFAQPEELVQLQQKKSWTMEDFNLLDDLLKACLLTLLIFPENAVIRKRNVINLWIGECLIKNTVEKTAEELGEDVVDNLLKFKVIGRYGSKKDLLVKKFQVLPHVRSKLKLYLDGALEMKYYSDGNSKYIRQTRLLLDRKKVTVGGLHTKDFTLRTIFNIGASYLNIRPQWVTDLKGLEVVQLGRWQDSYLHHIEVGSQEFLRELRTLKQLKYLSLHGISRIFELPSSIAELENILILDLKACHNMEKLPDDISSMKSLTHLIMSDCCLLEGMPKGVEKLTNLQVLKGFLITTSEKTPCRISDLANNLKKLRRLSIRIGSEAVIEDGEFQSLGSLSALRNLKISWSVSDPYIRVILPPSLRKLHLECFPGNSFIDCFMTGRYDSGLSELNITGGKLKSINPSMLMWKVEILRLKYLKQLNIDMDNLKVCFPGLKYVEIKQISNYSYIEHEWSL